MFRKFVLATSMISLVAMATVAEAALSKPPVDESCKRWELRGVANGNWVNAPKKEVWLCVSGDSKGRTSSTTASGGSGTPGSVSSSDTASSSGNNGKGNNGKGTPNGGKTDGGDPPGGGNTGNDGQG